MGSIAQHVTEMETGSLPLVGTSEQHFGKVYPLIMTCTSAMSLNHLNFRLIAKVKLFFRRNS